MLEEKIGSFQAEMRQDLRASCRIRDWLRMRAILLNPPLARRGSVLRSEQPGERKIGTHLAHVHPKSV
jgi:hypothetical protein